MSLNENTARTPKFYVAKKTLTAMLFKDRVLTTQPLVLRSKSHLPTVYMDRSPSMLEINDPTKMPIAKVRQLEQHNDAQAELRNTRQKLIRF